MRTNLPITDREEVYSDNDLLISKTDIQGKITYCNEIFLRIAGYAEHEMLGQPHNMVRHPNMPAAAFQDLWDTVRAGKEWNGFVKNRCKDGGYYWVNATVTPDIDSSTGKTIGYMSARRKATATQIRDAEALYAQMNASSGAR